MGAMRLCYATTILGLVPSKTHSQYTSFDGNKLNFQGGFLENLFKNSLQSCLELKSTHYMKP